MRGKGKRSSEKKGQQFQPFLSKVKKVTDSVVVSIGNSRVDLRREILKLRGARSTKVSLKPGSLKAMYSPFVRFELKLSPQMSTMISAPTYETEYFELLGKRPKPNIRVASYKKKVSRSTRLEIVPQIGFVKELVDSRLRRMVRKLPKTIYYSSLSKTYFRTEPEAVRHNGSLLYHKERKDILRSEKSFKKKLGALSVHIKQGRKRVNALKRAVKKLPSSKQKKLLEAAKNKLLVSQKKHKELETAMGKKEKEIMKRYADTARKKVLRKQIQVRRQDVLVFGEILLLPNDSCIGTITTKNSRSEFKAGSTFDGRITVGTCFSCSKKLSDPSSTSICAECGELLCNFDANQCRICKAPLCGRHHKICMGCNRVTCGSCMRKCPSCHKLICKDCLKRCENCSAQICAICEVKSSQMMVHEHNRCRECKKR